jgi:hypothetical protein
LRERKTLSPSGEMMTATAEMFEMRLFSTVFLLDDAYLR